MQKSENSKIDELLKRLSISQIEFARTLGTTTNAVTNWKKRELGRNVINKIVNAYPQVSMPWLLTGEGDVFIRDNAMQEERKESLFNTEKIAESLNSSRVPNLDKGVPYFNFDFQMGFDLKDLDDRTNADAIFDIEPYNNCTCWCNARGNSMYPTISSGDMVALKRVEDWSYLINGEIYGVITTNGLRTIKRVKDRGDKLLLIPDNKDSNEYEEQEIPKDIVRHLFLVKGVLKSF